MRGGKGCQLRAIEICSHTRGDTIFNFMTQARCSHLVHLTGFELHEGDEEVSGELLSVGHRRSS